MAAQAGAPRKRDFRRGLLAHLILVPAWTLVPAVLFGGCFVAGAPHGPKGFLAAAAVAAGLCRTETAATRGPLCLLIICIGAVAPSHRAVAVAGALTTSVLFWLAKGTTRDFRRRPAVWSFITGSLPQYYQQAELHVSVGGLHKERSCFAFHPHGCLSAGFGVNGMFNPEFIKHAGKVNWLLDAMLRYKNPAFRALCDAMTREDHAILSADKASFTGLMRKGENVGFIPGGFQDAVAFQYGKERTVLKGRKGFVKYCLQYGYRLHPVYTFGESQTFRAFTGLQALRMRISQWNIPMVAFAGFPLFPLLPRPQARLLSYVGPALEVPLKPDPSVEDVDYWHAKYMEALTKLFNEKRAEAGWPDAQLEII